MPTFPLVFAPWAWLFETAGEIATVATVFQLSGAIGAAQAADAASSKENAKVVKLERTLQQLDIRSDLLPRAAAANDSADLGLKQAA